MLKRYCSGGVIGTLCGSCVASLLFGLSQRMGTTLTFWQHSLSVFTDHYFLIFFMLPFFLLLCFFVMEEDSEIVILRFGAYWKYFAGKWSAMSGIVFCFLLVQILAIAVSGAGLPDGSNWLIQGETIAHEVIRFYGGIFATPAIALGAVLAYMLVGLCIIMMVTLWLAHFLVKATCVKILFLLYFLTVASIKISFIGQLPITSFNHLFILHHNLGKPGRLVLTVTTEILLTTLIAWTVKRHWQWTPFAKRKRQKGILPYYVKKLLTAKNLFILAAVVSVMTLWKMLRFGSNIDGEKFVIGLFVGHGTGYFRPLEFIEMLVLSTAPLYLIAVFLESSMAQCSTFVIVRLGKRRTLLGGILGSSLLLIAIYCSFLVVIPLASAGLVGIQLNRSTGYYLAIAVGLKFVDISLQFLWLLVAFLSSGHVTIGFISLLCVNILCLLPLGFMRLIPFGNSNLARIHLPLIGTEGISLSLAVSSSLLLSALFLFWLLVNGYRRLPKK